ncbi:uncharacterized protein LOC62_03G004287 [Vanrija pseudolonga]|uniref:Uncharacterized protein n=1 Tax=Vanrija pseudolonga TaxID=143232 RepID=A0AAF1BK81_9TREE|nr:hypothetical protein LOC62_03G004287 [Vanrija pseudolonga]
MPAFDRIITLVVAIISVSLYLWIAVISAKELGDVWNGHLLYRVIDISILLLAPSIVFDAFVKIVLVAPGTGTQPTAEKYFPKKAGLYKTFWPITLGLALLFLVLEIVFVVTNHSEWRYFLRNVRIVGLGSLYAAYDFYVAARELADGWN